MRTQSHTKQREAGDKPHGHAREFVVLTEGQAMVYEEQTTPAQRRAAAGYLLANMPGVARPGQKTAQQILKETRDSSK